LYALVLLAAGLALCYGESTNLTYDMSDGRFNAHSERRRLKYSNMLAGGSYGFWLRKKLRNTAPRVYLLSCSPTLLKFNIGLFTGAGACVDGVAEAAGRAAEDIKRRG
jgi:hypothetical protein